MASIQHSEKQSRELYRRGGPLDKPIFVIHTIAHARAAAAAAAARKIPVCLLSPPGGSETLGAMIFTEILSSTRQEHPAADLMGILDCGDRAGDALNALRLGAKAVIFTGNAETAARLTDIAHQFDALLLHSRPRGCDLCDVPHPLETCKQVLANKDAS